MGPCDFLPYNGKCVKFSPFLQPEYRDEVVFLVWNENAQIVEVLDLGNPHSRILQDATDLIIFAHDIGQSSCSPEIRKLIKSALKKKPGTALITIDYSPTVSFESQSQG